VNLAVLLDAGPLVALLDERDHYHAWAVEQVARLRPPFRTCEAALAEAFHLLRKLPRAQAAILEMAAAGVLTVTFQLFAHVTEVLAHLKRYATVPMSLADACLVRMAEVEANAVLLTLDSDFQIYRRHKRQTIPIIIPPRK
jgi:predicted nucleic acid-binding protein